jgi:hypothetical protein
MNCGAPMQLPEVPVGVAMDELPAVPPPSAAFGWNAAVPTPPAGTRRHSSTVAIVIGIVAVAAFIISVVMLSSGDMSASASVSAFTVYVLFALWILSGFFWLWMLIDAISNSRVAWALAIFFLGVFGALGYALLGKTPKTASF